jgi:hypothetical protein
MISIVTFADWNNEGRLKSPRVTCSSSEDAVGRPAFLSEVMSFYSSSFFREDGNE